MGRREPCPACGSRSGYASYANGSYCFRCGHSVRVDVPLSELFEAKMPMTSAQLLDMPDDLSTAFPREPLTWIRKYGIQDLELQRNNVQWSPSTKRLYFPIYDDEEGQTLIACESRNFSGDGPKTIWKGQAKEDVIHIIGWPVRETLVLVEDILSAIKVGRTHATLCLFGSHVSDHLLWRLRKLLEPHLDLTMWLDSDKLGTSLKTAQRASGMGFTTRVIHTDLDPKAYPDHHIKEIILDQLNDKMGEIHGT